MATSALSVAQQNPGQTVHFSSGGSATYRGEGSYNPVTGLNYPVSSSGSMADQLTQAIDQIYKITERNTARSEAQAAELRDWQERQNQIAMQYNTAEAQKNRDWQQMMSNTAHQREVADLQAAGLNPILSASGGNGASVTSGATASGVTSSGAKGEVDTSLDGALVTLLGSMWSAQTQLESQRISAQNNLAIAEKNNSMSELVARMYTEQSREASQLAAMTSLSQTEISAATSRAVASISANASYYASDISRQNTILNTEAEILTKQLDIDQKDRAQAKSLLVDILRIGVDASVSLRGQNVNASSAMDVARENHKNNTTGSAWSILNYLNGVTDKFKNGFTGFSRGSGFSR